MSTTKDKTPSTKGTGTLEGPFKDAKGRDFWRGRIRLKDGTRTRVEIREDRRYDRDKARGHLAYLQEIEDETETAYKRKLALLAQDEAAVVRAQAAGTPGETVETWFARYYAWCEARASGGETAHESHGRFTKWVTPTLGHVAMREVTRDDLEAVVAVLDAAVASGALAWKSASNIWGLVTAGFNVAAGCKDKTVRVLTTNPCSSVAGPDKGIKKRKPFLRPDEIVALLGCEAVPLERRQVYAVATYTAMRQGEIRALRVADVDLDAMQILVGCTMKNGKEKTRTKTGRARVVQIEPNLAPLLRLLVEGGATDARVLDVRAHNRCATNLRADLLLAGCSRQALHVETEMAAHLTFHNLRDTCLTHMAVRRDAPQDVQWRAGHTTAEMTEKYIGNARYEAGQSFGTPLPPLPPTVLVPPPVGHLSGHRRRLFNDSSGGAGNRSLPRVHFQHGEVARLSRQGFEIPANSPVW